MKSLIRSAVIMASAFLLCSCIGLQVETVFNADGSGSMRLQMRISKELLQMGEEEGAEMDVPLSKEDLEETYRGVKGVTVREVVQEDTETDRVITALVDFDDFGAVTEVEGFPGQETSLAREGGATVFRTRIGDKSGAAGLTGGGAADGGRQELELDESMITAIRAFMEGYSFEYRITAPKKVKRHTHGELTNNGRTVVYNMPMGDLIVLDEPFTFEITW